MDLIKGAFYSIVYVIVGGIFDFVCYVYEIFYALATLNLFDNEIYTDIVNRIYVVLGLIMLFVLAYSLLRAVINPDEFAKGETSFPNMIKNIVISLVIITVLPAIFNVAMNFQNSILMQGSIPKLILAEYDESNIQSGGRDIAYYAYLSIMYPNVSSKICSPDQSVTSCRSKVKGNGWLGTTNGATLSSVDERVKSGELSFTYYQDYSEATRDGNITFQWFLGIIVGIFLLWVIANFCFDMALRVIKLTFYQLIAPIPVVCRIIPGGQFKGVFSTWVKQTVSVYVEVFVRIAILSIGIFLVGIITEYFNGFDTYGSLGTIQTLVLRLLLIIAVVMFMKEAPGLISKMFNMDTGGIKLGLKDKLAAGGVFAAGAFVGGGAGLLAKNAVAGYQEFHKTKGQGFKKRLGALGRGVSSTVAGATSRALRGGKAGLKAKSFGESKDAAAKAISTGTEKRVKRYNYKSSHGGTARGAFVGHVRDTLQKGKEFLGIDQDLETLNKEKAVADEMMGFYKTMAGYVEDNEAVVNYAGLYEAEMKREIPETVFDSQRYQDVLNSNVALMQNDARYAGMSTNELYNLAASRVDRSQFVRQMTSQERAIASHQREERIKMYDNLKKMATIRAVNDKLNKKQNGKIVDSRFQAVANQVKTFKDQYATYDFVQNMNLIDGVTWDPAWNAIMDSGNAAQIDALMDQFKNGANNQPSPISFFGDSEIAKNRSGAVSAEIATKIQEKKKENS